jgi:hypothetical protein
VYTSLDEENTAWEACTVFLCIQFFSRKVYTRFDRDNTKPVFIFRQDGIYSFRWR